MNGNQFQQLKDNLAHHYRMITDLQSKHRAETGQNFCPAGIGKVEVPAHRQGCEIYTPNYAPEIEVHYNTEAYAVDICDILINGQEVSEYGYSMLSERDWESEIEAHLKKQADDQATDQAGETWEIRQFEGIR